MRILAFAAVKGGVGKTTAAVNVAAAAARSGVPTVVWDLDPQAAACHLLNVEGVKGAPPRRGWLRRRGHHPTSPTALSHLSVIPADTTLLDGSTVSSAREFGRVADEFDIAVLDLPAGVDSGVEAAVRAGADIVVPIVPSMLSVRAYEQFGRFVADLRDTSSVSDSVRVRGFVSMADPTLKRHADFVDELRSSHPEVLKTWIPQTVEIERACEQRRPVAEAFPKGRSAVAFKELWGELSPG